MATFYNQATLSYNGTTTSSNVTVGELLSSLGITKSAISTSYGADDGVSYIISIVNSTASPITGLTLTDDLGAYDVGGTTVYPLTYTVGSLKAYVGGSAVTPPTVTATEPLTLSGISIPQNEALILVYEAMTNVYTPLATGSTLTNTATVSGTLGEASASASVTADNTTELTIAKAICPATVTAGESVNYTFIIQNSGNTASDDTVTVSDVFTPALTGISVTLNGAPLPATSYTYNEATGEFATLPGAITVPAAEYSQDPTTGIVSTTPGVIVITVTGTIA